MKHHTTCKPGVRRHEREIARDEAAAAHHMNSILVAKARIYMSTHLDVPRTASSQCPLNDADIAATVNDAIGCITTVPVETLQVDVKDGWVTLRGTLESRAQREAVESVVLRSAGVRGVVNSITIDKKPTPALLKCIANII